MAQRVGEIGEIYRYPIKSFAGERLDACRLERYGVYGDRFGAFHDGRGQGWDSYVTARQWPKMLAYKARLIGDELEVVAADGRTFGWDEALLEEIRELTSRQLIMTDWQAPHLEQPELLSVDLGSALIVTDATVRELSSQWGKHLDVRRFRPNFVIKTTEVAGREQSWIGKKLRIGETMLHVFRYCERCSMITVDPDTQERDPSLLQTVKDRMALKFGVYASVISTGVIHTGDPVYVEELCS